jgi:hypothetical protein
MISGAIAGAAIEADVSGTARSGIFGRPVTGSLQLAKVFSDISAHSFIQASNITHPFSLQS